MNTTARVRSAKPVSRSLQGASQRQHTVKAGETLSSIASQHGTSAPALKAANPHLKPAKALGAGQVLALPQPGTDAAVSADAPPPPSRPSAATQAAHRQLALRNRGAQALRDRLATAELKTPVAAAGSTTPVNLNSLSTQQQYDYLRNVVVQQAGGDSSAWKTGEGEVNLIGIRSFQDGKPTTAEGNTYNDSIYAVRMVDGRPQVTAFSGSTDAGIFPDPAASGFGYTDPQGTYQGISHLADGFYPDAWVRGAVAAGGAGLRQAGEIRIHADSNNNGVIDETERLGPDGQGVTKGAGWQIQFHTGGAGTEVNRWSAGCQVIHANQWQAFQELVGNAPNAAFSYALVDSANLPPLYTPPRQFVPE